MKHSFWYHSQFKRHIMHMIRLFGNFQVQTGTDTSGNPELRRVPCKWARMGRDVAMFLRDGSENKLLSAPGIAIDIEQVEMPRDRARNSTEIDELQVFERYYDESAVAYTQNLGNTYRVKRVPPAPVNITFRVYFWTTIQDHKFQLLEQIYPIFHQPVQMQISDSELDPCSKFDLELTSVNYSSRSTPAGTDDQMDIMDMTFLMRTWLMFPAKIDVLKTIHQINANLMTVGSSDLDEEMFNWGIQDINRIIVTPGQHWIEVRDDLSIRLLGSNGSEINDDTSWRSLIENYGPYRENITQIRLRPLVQDPTDNSRDIVGTVILHSSDPTLLNFSMNYDTLPSTTLPAVNGVIDPYDVQPGNGLPLAAAGQRYIVLSEIGDSISFPMTTAAEPNDIVQFDGSVWNVVFDASVETSEQVVGSVTTQNRYVFQNGEWFDPVRGKFSPGWFKLVIQD